MSKSKTSFLKHLKDSVSLHQRRIADDRLAIEYFDLWLRQPEEKDEWDGYWFSQLYGVFERKIDRQKSRSERLSMQLFQECGLQHDNPEHRDIMLNALAEVAFPARPGAKTVWTASQYDQLWHDVNLVQDKYPDVTHSSGRVNATAAASALLKEFGTRYENTTRKSTTKSTIDDLRKRVSEAMGDYELSPNISIADFDYIVRSDPACGPSRAANLTKQAAFVQGSPDAERAKRYEAELLSRTQAVLLGLGVYITRRSKMACWAAARKIARYRVRSETSADTSLGKNSGS